MTDTLAKLSQVISKRSGKKPNLKIQVTNVYIATTYYLIRKRYIRQKAILGTFHINIDRISEQPRTSISRINVDANKKLTVFKSNLIDMTQRGVVKLPEEYHLVINEK